MNQSKLVTVIVPIYKVELYIKKCVDSILQQTYKNLEIILVDDGSPDKCPIICDHYARLDARVKVIHKENGGQAEARNFGLRIASGDYIYFVDGDDYLELDALAILVNVAQKEKADIVIADIKFVDSSNQILYGGKKQYPFDRDRVFTASQSAYEFAGLDWGPWNKLYTADLHKMIEFPNGKIHEDEAIMFELFKNSNKCVYVNRQLYNYLKRKDSTTTREYTFKKMDWFIVWLKNLSYVQLNFPTCENKVIKKLSMISIYNLNNLLRMKNSNNDKFIKFILDYFNENLNKILKSRLINIKTKIRILIAVTSLRLYKLLFVR